MLPLVTGLLLLLLLFLASEELCVEFKSGRKSLSTFSVDGGGGCVTAINAISIDFVLMFLRAVELLAAW